eukprot:COSAG01_NODE_591_length_15119_cov_19.340879_6_plen_48_part_00
MGSVTDSDTNAEMHSDTQTRGQAPVTQSRSSSVSLSMLLSDMIFPSS